MKQGHSIWRVGKKTLLRIAVYLLAAGMMLFGAWKYAIYFATYSTKTPEVVTWEDFTKDGKFKRWPLDWRALQLRAVSERDPVLDAATDFQKEDFKFYGGMGVSGISYFVYSEADYAMASTYPLVGLAGISCTPVKYKGVSLSVAEKYGKAYNEEMLRLLRANQGDYSKPVPEYENEF